ncbi:MAG: hypothetical protein ACFBSF_11485 [Leptolyngbyaceae cyanobacterium]
MSALTWVLLGIDGLVIVAIVALAIFFRYFLYSFLALSQPTDPAEILVVEGWLEEASFSAVIAEFEHGGYQYLVTVGGPVHIGFLLTKYKTVAEVAAANLRSLGFDASKLIVVASENALRDRTVATAIAFKNWLSEHKAEVKGINIYSNNVHARRSYLIYKNHLPTDIKLGVIASKSRGHSPDTWWKSSSGTKVILMEFIAYCYVMYRLSRPRLADYDY